MARAHVRQEMLVLASWSWPLGPSGLGVKRLAVSMKGREGMWPGEGSLSHVEGVGSGGMDMGAVRRQWCSGCWEVHTGAAGHTRVSKHAKTGSAWTVLSESTVGHHRKL